MCLINTFQLSEQFREFLNVISSIIQPMSHVFTKHQDFKESYIYICVIYKYRLLYRLKNLLPFSFFSVNKQHLKICHRWKSPFKINDEITKYQTHFRSLYIRSLVTPCQHWVGQTFAFRAALICHVIDSTRCWKYS